MRDWRKKPRPFLRSDIITLKASDLIVTQVNRKKIELNGMVHLSIKVGGSKTWSKLYLAPDLDQTMILRDEWLKKNQGWY